MFKLYDCKLRLAGNVLNEVPKQRVTAPEIEVLRALHGGDAVVGVKAVGEIERSHKEERDRIYRLFADPSKAMPDQVTKKLAMMRGLFGHDRLPLPTSLEDASEADEGDGGGTGGIEATEADRPRRTKVTKQETPAFAA